MTKQVVNLYTTNQVIGERKGMLLAEQFFNQPVRKDWSSKRVRETGEVFYTKFQHTTCGIAEGFKFMSWIISRQRESYD